MKCPICGSKVTYEGMNNLECAGSVYLDGACPNYKLSQLKFDPISFDDTVVDWEWFVPFCGWLSQISSLHVVPSQYDEHFFKAEVGKSDFSFFVALGKETRKSLVRWLLRDRVWGGFLEPRALRGEMKL